MRKDIEIHINTGDITLDSQRKTASKDFRWTPHSAGLARYIYGEITVSNTVTERSIWSNGVYVNIPYTPIYKEFYIRIKRLSEGGAFSYLQNPTDGSHWFIVVAGLYGGILENVFASQLLMIAERGYHIRLNQGTAQIYSSASSDFNIVKANRQNSNLLLKCLPTNHYRFPLSGVGLIRWMNSNVHHTELSQVLQREFSDDGVIVKNAGFNLETKDLNLDLDTTNIDQ